MSSLIKARLDSSSPSTWRTNPMKSMRDVPGRGMPSAARNRITGTGRHTHTRATVIAPVMVRATHGIPHHVPDRQVGAQMRAVRAEDLGNTVLPTHHHHPPVQEVPPDHLARLHVAGQT